MCKAHIHTVILPQRCSTRHCREQFSMHKALRHVCNGGDSRTKCLPTSYLIYNIQEAEIDKPGTCKGDNGRLRRTLENPGGPRP